MKKINSYLLAILAIVGTTFQSCDNNDEGYSLGDIAVDWATVKIEGAHTYSLTGDTWGTLWPAASSVFWFTPVDGQRVIAVFNPLYDNFQGYDTAVKVEGVKEVLTKRVEEMTVENEKEYGNDPIYIQRNDMWIGSNYLNVVFKQNIPNKKKHRVSLVQNKTVQSPDDNYIHLEFRYNTYEDTTDYWANGAVSFNLNSLDITSQTKGIKVKMNSAVNGETEVTFDLKNEPMPQGVNQMDFTNMEIQ